MNRRYIRRKAWDDQKRRVLRMVEAGAPCALCGDPIDPGARWIVRDGRRELSPWSLEADERLAPSRGGDQYDPDNIQPAHRLCNQLKSDKTPAEWARWLALYAARHGERYSVGAYLAGRTAPAPERIAEGHDGSTSRAW